MEEIQKSVAPILVVGSGNAEFIINLETEFVLDRKYAVNYVDLLGGSGVNYSLRFLDVGIPVFPVLSIGKDGFGEKIRERIFNASQTALHSGKNLSFIASDKFFSEKISTPRTTIIVEKDQRTVFAEMVRDCESFKEHLLNGVYEFENNFAPLKKSMIIGHIHADNPDVNKNNPGECTK
jgi:hypothetical protein